MSRHEAVWRACAGDRYGRTPGGMTILVSGMMAGVPGQGGATWAVLQYLLGLRSLGHEVYFVEPVEAASILPREVAFEASVNANYFRQVVREFQLERTAALLLAGTERTVGLTYGELRSVARRADLLLNLSGVLADPALAEPIPRRAFLDLDPGFVQLWATAEGIDMRLEGHTHFVTVGLSVGDPGVPVPTCGRSWIPTPQPIALEHWPVVEPIDREAFTTVANWRAYGSIEYEGVFYGQKAHSLRRLMELPRQVPERFELALSIHAGERRDREALARNGWHLVEPSSVAATPDEYRTFIQGSRAELGIAKSGYVAARCGWFSDRSICYLASGRPVLAQETGFSEHLEVGEGLLAFTTQDDAVERIAELRSGYRRHARAARAVAERHFAAERVLPPLLERLEAGR